MRSAVIAAALLLGATSCAAAGPEAPSVDASPAVIAGVVWFDDGDGLINSGEEAATGVTVRIGEGRSTVNSSAVTADDRGGFVAMVPADFPDIELDVFVEVELEVPGPSDASIVVHHRVDADRGDVTVELPVIRPERCTAFSEDEARAPVFEAAVLEAAVLEAAGPCGHMLLPDLVPLVEDFGQSPTQPVAQQSMQLDMTTEPGRELLRFASATANVGAGPLHMIPDSSPVGERIGTWQRLWSDTNSFVDIRTGEFIFHEDHDHFHLESFEQYRLLSTDGEVVRTGEKVSFCLIDSLPVGSAAQTRGQGIFLDAVCEQAGQQQALNSGWADYYAASLPDQWIDVTGVEPGDYLVEIVVDPEDQFIESDKTNNRAVFAVTLEFLDRDS